MNAITDQPVQTPALREPPAARRPAYAKFLLNWVVAHMALMSTLYLVFVSYEGAVYQWMPTKSALANILLYMCVWVCVWLLGLWFTIGSVQQVVLRTIPLSTGGWPFFLLVSGTLGSFFLGASMSIKDLSFVEPLIFGLIVGALQSSALGWNLKRVIWFSLANGIGIGLSAQCYVLFDLIYSNHDLSQPGSECSVLAFSGGVYAAITGPCLAAFAYRAPTP